MNTYSKFCANVFVAKCEEQHEKGELITVTTKYGKENECIVHNLVKESGGYYYYSITRADGYNMQERAKRKADAYAQYAYNAGQRSAEYSRKAHQHDGFLSLGEPIKVGHHSERRHRRIVEDAWRNTGKAVEELNKAADYREKSYAWEKRAEDINLSMPESIDYYAEKLEKAQEYHAGMKSGKYPRHHAYSLTYAKKAVNEAKKNYDLAVKLWG